MNEEKQNSLKRNLKDIVFCDLFASDENFPQIYHSLFPEDSEWESYDYKRIYIGTTITNNIVNDLSFLAGNKLICFEAQSTWKKVDLIRFVEYLIFSLYTAKSSLSDFELGSIWDELFVLYTGTNSNPETEYNCLRANNININPTHTVLNTDIRVLSLKRGNIPDTEIFNTYLKFCETFDQVVKVFGRTRVAAAKLVETCIERNIYAEFFKNRRGELMENFVNIFSQEFYNQKQQEKISQLQQENKEQKVELEEQKVELAEQKVELEEQKVELEEKNRMISEYAKRFGPLLDN